MAQGGWWRRWCRCPASIFAGPGDTRLCPVQGPWRVPRGCGSAALRHILSSQSRAQSHLTEHLLCAPLVSFHCNMGFKLAFANAGLCRDQPGKEGEWLPFSGEGRTSSDAVSQPLKTNYHLSKGTCQTLFPNCPPQRDINTLDMQWRRVCVLLCVPLLYT